MPAPETEPEPDPEPDRAEAPASAALTPEDAAALAEGAALFDEGRYFDAHEAWEHLWRRTVPGPERALVQSLIQLAAALHLAHERTRARPAGAVRNLEKAAAKLAPLPGRLFGARVDVDALRGLLAGLLAQAAQLGPERFGALAPAPAPRPRVTSLLGLPDAGAP